MQTLEQLGAAHAAELGFDASSPQAQAALAQGAQALRAANPGKSDEEVYAQNRPMIEQQIKDTALKLGPKPVAPVAGTKPADTGYQPSTKYSDAAATINKEFSPEAREAAKGNPIANAIGDGLVRAGRNASLYARTVGGPAANRALDEQYAGIVAKGNQPVADFDARRKAAIARMDEQIKAGTADANQMKNELSRMGLEQAIAERKDKAAIAEAEQDPNSVTSKSMRQLAMESVTDEAMKAQLQNMNAAQIKQWMPVIEKRYLKKIDDETKRLAIADKEQARADAERVKKDDRAFEAGEKAKDRAATITAAGIKASGSGGGPKTSDVTGAASLAEAATKAKTELVQTNSTLRMLDEAEKLLPNVRTDPVTGAIMGTGLGKMLSGPERQRLNTIQTSLAGQLANMAKGAQTDQDAKRFETIVNMLSQTDPSAGIKAAREALLETQAAQVGRVATAEQAAAITAKKVGITSPAPASGETTRAQYDALPKGATYVKDGVTYTKN